MPSRLVASILLESSLPQLDRPFDYAVPDDLGDRVRIGRRVRVPLRSAGRLLNGYVVGLGSGEGIERDLVEIESVVSDVELLPEQLLALVRRVADRAAGSASDVLRLVIPRRMVRAERSWLASEKPGAPVVTPEQVDFAAEELGRYLQLAERLEAGGRIALEASPGVAPAADGDTASWARLFAAMAIAQLAAGRSTVIAVPDYRDQELLERALSGRVPEGYLVRDDARQPAAARYGGYLRMLHDQPCIVIGNRSAVYAPVHAPGLIALWDDGDSLMAEPLSPGVHARDAALVRQELEGCALVLAGHSRSTDAERLVQLGWLDEVTAQRRVLPRVTLDPPRSDASAGARVSSGAFAVAREAIEHGPVLIQVARPGYAPSLVCAECAESARCRQCSGPLRARSAGVVPECSWCGAAAHGWACGHCHRTRVRMASSGSERTAHDLGRAFPGVRVVVADGEHQVLRVGADPALVIATRGAEPLAEGGYRAVVLLDGERMLLADSLRIGEACLRWWSNAAALAAPGAPVRLVGVMGEIGTAFATWSQAAYARRELAERAPLRLPPTVRVAALTGREDSVLRAMGEVAAAVPELPDGSQLGPVPLPGGDGHRALIRFEYGVGHRVVASLRKAVVADALRTRRPGKRPRTVPANTLRVRVDVPDVEL